MVRFKRTRRLEIPRRSRIVFVAPVQVAPTNQPLDVLRLGLDSLAEAIDLGNQVGVRESRRGQQ